jgi:hypothetical protein
MGGVDMDEECEIGWKCVILRVTLFHSTKCQTCNIYVEVPK